MNSTAMAAEEELGVDLNLFTAAGLALLVLAVFQVPAVRYISDEDQNIMMKTQETLKEVERMKIFCTETL